METWKARERYGKVLILSLEMLKLSNALNPKPSQRKININININFVMENKEFFEMSKWNLQN